MGLDDHVVFAASLAPYDFDVDAQVGSGLLRYRSSAAVSAVSA